MKKYFLIAAVLVSTFGTLTSCTQDENVNYEDLNIQSPDKDEEPDGRD